MPEVTIAIPLYNASKYIAETLNSALSQTFDNIEILIIDDKSTDDSLKIVNEIKSKSERGESIHIICNEENQGVAYCRNLAINKAAGKYLFFLDSDDLISDNCIALLYNAITSEKTEVAIGSHIRIDDNGQVLSKNILPSIVSHKEKELAQLRYGKYHRVLQTYIWNALFDLSFLKNVGIKFGYYRVCEDVIFWYDLYPKIRSFVLLMNVTYIYKIRPNSLSGFNYRDKIPLKEIQNAISVCHYENSNLNKYLKEPFFEDMCCNTMRYCFYCFLHIYIKRKNYTSEITNTDLSKLLLFPINFYDIISCKHKRHELLFFYTIYKLPFFVSSHIIIFIMNLLK